MMATLPVAASKASATSLTSFWHLSLSYSFLFFSSSCTNSAYFCSSSLCSSSRLGGMGGMGSAKQLITSAAPSTQWPDSAGQGQESKNRLSAAGSIFPSASSVCMNLSAVAASFFSSLSLAVFRLSQILAFLSMRNTSLELLENKQNCRRTIWKLSLSRICNAGAVHFPIFLKHLRKSHFTQHLPCQTWNLQGTVTEKLHNRDLWIERLAIALKILLIPQNSRELALCGLLSSEAHPCLPQRAEIFRFVRPTGTRQHQNFTKESELQNKTILKSYRVLSPCLGLDI